MTHKTKMVLQYPSGAQQWDCLSCARSVLWQWHPRVKSIVLEEGNSGAIHSGSAHESLILESDLVDPAEKEFFGDLEAQFESQEE